MRPTRFWDRVRIRHDALGPLMDDPEPARCVTAPGRWIISAPPVGARFRGTVRVQMKAPWTDPSSRLTGLSREELLSRLSKNLPEAVDKYTPEGRIPTATELAKS